MEINTPKRLRTNEDMFPIYPQSPPLNENAIYPWNRGEDSGSPASSPEIAMRHGLLNRTSRRGRPRSEALSNLMMEGSTSPSNIKCGHCNRVFPREKSLQAHLRTHTGERPYPCDYPGCTRAFTQSGQLKTHQRLHTGEKPFVCAAISCTNRFTHANRHCPEHPYDNLKRSDDFILQPMTTNPEQSQEVYRWLEKYRLEREDRTPTRKTPVSRKSKDSESENSIQSLSGTPNNPYKSRKGLITELDIQDDGKSSNVKKSGAPKVIQWNEPLSQEEDSGDEHVDYRSPAIRRNVNSTMNEQPKKRWLREACQDQSLWGEKLELARPLQWDNAVEDTIRLNENQYRPSVLVLATKDENVSRSELPEPEHNFTWLKGTNYSSRIPELSKPTPISNINNIESYQFANFHNEQVGIS